MARTRIEIAVRPTGDEALTHNVGMLLMGAVRKMHPRAAVVLVDGNARQSEVADFTVSIGGELDEAAGEELLTSGPVGDVICFAHRWPEDLAGRRLTRLELKAQLDGMLSL